MFLLNNKQASVSRIIAGGSKVLERPEERESSVKSNQGVKLADFSDDSVISFSGDEI